VSRAYVQLVVGVRADQLASGKGPLPGRWELPDTLVMGRMGSACGRRPFNPSRGSRPPGGSPRTARPDSCVGPRANSGSIATGTRSTGDERWWRRLALLLCPLELPDTGLILRHERTRLFISFGEAATGSRHGRELLLLSPKPARQPSRRDSGTGCPHMPRTARSSASSRVRRSFKTRYATFGFSDQANLDEGSMWPDCLRSDGVDRRRRGKD
jgi:hypothetical protein